MTLRELMDCRERLLIRCAKVDRAAAIAREEGRTLTVAERAGFSELSELRAIEHAIAKLKEAAK